jgi:hypothetical protein
MTEFDLKMVGAYSPADMRRMEVWGGIASPDLTKARIASSLKSLAEAGSEETSRVSTLANLFSQIGSLEFIPFDIVESLPVDGGNHIPGKRQITSDKFILAGKTLDSLSGGKSVNDKGRTAVRDCSLAVSLKLVPHLGLQEDKVGILNRFLRNQMVNAISR